MLPACCFTCLRACTNTTRGGGFGQVRLSVRPSLQAASSLQVLAGLFLRWGCRVVGFWGVALGSILLYSCMQDTRGCALLSQAVVSTYLPLRHFGQGLDLPLVVFGRGGMLWSGRGAWVAGYWMVPAGKLLGWVKLCMRQVPQHTAQHSTSKIFVRCNVPPVTCLVPASVK